MNSRFPCVIPVVERCSTSAQVVQSQWLGGGGGRGGGEKNVLNVGAWWRHNELLSSCLRWFVEQVMLWP